MNTPGTVLDFALPDLGEGLTEAEVVRWFVAVGDEVGVDQPVVEVETAKAVVEVPCPYAGVVTRLCGEPGTTLRVGTPLLSVAATGAPPEATPAGAAPATGTSADAAPATTAPADPAPAGAETADPAPAPAPVTAAGGAADPGDDGSGHVLVGYGTPPSPRRRGRTAGDDRRPEQVRVVSPVVRRLARERAVDLRTLRGTGPDGLILRADVERAAPAPADEPEAVRIPLRGLRGTVADTLTRAHREIPAATAWVDVDATRLLEARRRLAATATGGAAAAEGPGASPRVSLFGLLARVCTATLAEFPALNSRVDTERREIVRLSAVHLGFAAHTDRGLVVPVIRDAHRRTLPELAAETERLTTAAREGRLTPAELSGSTFTLNNFGALGVDGSTPLLHHPQAGMLGIGRIVPRVWAVDGRPEIRDIGQFSVTFDHRVCDGGTAAGFLRRVADLVEEPLSLLRLL
ncbi:dihydrolipoamide acetyltransferase family protein [Streptomyces roseolus]|uniref:dihydrolipoamide acetyltransferase family protein n=1 Tax=Streptomyces roseolus TaxID=67358 RepID=UPI001673E146|nr:dihydrolipoamide acetyltransferase family protein [Streptomyces roseolus]GGR24186.1 dihydrolipoamide acetyltransferase component of pyruvate dehydrogenase complex [Streptomyces roseolus]